MKAEHETQLKAFVIALNGLESPLPEAAYDSIHQMGLAIAQQNPDRALQILHELVQTHPDLSDRYEAARLSLRRDYQTQQRSKSAVATLEKTGIDLEQTLILLLTRFSPQTRTLFPDTPDSTTAQADFWAKSDRIAVMVAGGAFLGGAIAQIPGALIGSLLAGSYGWYIGFGKPKQPTAP